MRDKSPMDGLKLADMAAVVGLDRNEFRMLRYRGALALPSLIAPRLNQGTPHLDRGTRQFASIAPIDLKSNA